MIPVSCHPHFKMDSNLSTEYIEKSCTEQLRSDGEVVLWNEGRQKLNTASPSVIRRGLCMVRDQGKKFLFLFISY